MRSGGGHTAAADLVYLYAATQQWFFAERRYRAFEGELVRLNHADLFLDRTATGKRQSQPKQELDSAALHDGVADEAQHGPLRGEGDSDGSGDDLDGSNVGGSRGTTARAEKMHQTAAPLTAPQPIGPAVRKKYSQQYIWGQLNGWFKQTVYDPQPRCQQSGGERCRYRTSSLLTAEQRLGTTCGCATVMVPLRGIAAMHHACRVMELALVGICLGCDHALMIGSTTDECCG